MATPTRNDRRDVLKLIGLSPAVAIAAAGTQEADAAEASPADKPAVGYRESEHVRTYYRLARD